LGNLYAMRNVLGRINANLGSINAPVSTLQTAGGNLFQVAQQKYGDATAWTGIAKANKLTDPFMTGLNSLTIPPVADKSAGVLTS
jgi:nucleoid-associated protein YgaU